ncbi:MAG: TatD family hydrolase [Firmicutes bacterium]|nr:TatD family hydrolase [Bacillota bacterium]
MLFDSHTHINNDTYTDEERAELIAEIEDSALKYICDIGFNMPSCRLALEHARKYPWCYAAVGMHPHDTEGMTEEDLEEIRQMAADPRVVAIGEIGLDFYYDLSPRDTQRYWFRRQIQLANELKMPIVIHSREADREVMDILIEEGAFSEERKGFFADGTPHVDIHCYSGSAEFAKEYLKLGAVLGVDGPLTYKNNKKTVAVVETVPLESLLIETDAPYLTPVPFRGKPNKSQYVEYVARKLAEIKGLEYEEVALATMENAKKFFGIE